MLLKATDLLSGLAEKHKSSLLYSSSLLPLPWLLAPETRPSVPYLASCHVSMALIGLTQFCQYIATARALGLSPEEMRSKFSGATGHSQGVVTATIISKQLDGKGWEAFENAALEGLKLLFYIGMRGLVDSQTLHYLSHSIMQIRSFSTTICSSCSRQRVR